MTVTPTLDPDLVATLRRLKLGQLVDTLPERLALAKANKLSHAEFLGVVLADEVTRRDTTSAAGRCHTGMRMPHIGAEKAAARNGCGE